MYSTVVVAGRLRFARETASVKTADGDTGRYRWPDMPAAGIATHYIVPSVRFDACGTRVKLSMLSGQRQEWLSASAAHRG
jgi:hypothetical protein